MLGHTTQSSERGLHCKQSPTVLERIDLVLKNLRDYTYTLPAMIQRTQPWRSELITAQLTASHLHRIHCRQILDEPS